METDRAPGRRALVAAAVLAVVAASTPTAARAAGWSRPFRFAGPVSLDVLPAEIGFSPGGEAAVAFGVQDEDNPSSSRAFATLRSPRGGLGGTRPVPGAREVLDLAFDGQTLELLTGASQSASSCCGSVQVTRLTGRPRTLVRQLTGATTGRLLTLPGRRLLAVIATAEGVWVAQSSAGDGFAPPHRLTASGSVPQTLAATTLQRGASLVGWTQGNARSIFVASGSEHQAPHGARAPVTVAAGRRIDELGIAPAGSRATAAWIESWYDGRGAYHSQAVVADLGSRPRARAFPIAGELASGLSFAGDARGDQVLAWKACDRLGSCTARAVTRAAGRRFGQVATLGAIDASQEPSAAIGPRGDALVGWVDDGRVLAAGHRVRAARFGAPRAVSATNRAADLTIAFGPAGNAVAAWTQGTLAPSVVGAIYRGR